LRRPVSVWLSILPAECGDDFTFFVAFRALRPSACFPVSFGTAKVETFITLPKFILKFFQAFKPFSLFPVKPLFSYRSTSLLSFRLTPLR